MRFTEEDKIGRQDIVNKISSLVDNLQEDEHFCLALNGEWGSGKSYIMDMLREKFAEREEYIVINYDAWKNNFYSDPLIAILYCILDSIPKQKLGKKDLHLVMLEVKQLARDKIANNLDSLIEKLYKMGGWTSVCAFVMEIIKQVIKQAKISILDNKLFDNYKSYQTLLNESIAVLNALTWKKTDDGIQRRLIILVDEIDRCLPNEQLICLERIHHLFGIRNCCVIIAMNKKQIINVFDQRYGGGGQDYLRKFFDYNFLLSTNGSIYFKNALWDKIVETSQFNLFNAISKEQMDYLQLTIFHVLKSEFQDISKIDNRTLNNLLRHTYNIAGKLPDKKIDFAYLFLIVWSISVKIYNKNKYNQVLNLKTTPKFYYDIADRTVSYVGLSSYRQVILSNTYYEIYRDSNINSINFYINMWRARGNKELESNIRKIFGGDIVLDPNYEDVLKYIFDAVESISE